MLDNQGDLGYTVVIGNEETEPKANAMLITYHIRQRLARRRGNQFYKDKSIREAATFCGAEPTEHDTEWQYRRTHTKSDGFTFRKFDKFELVDGEIVERFNEVTLKSCGNCAEKI